MPSITPFAKRIMMINVIVFVLMFPMTPQGSLLSVLRWMGLTPDMWGLQAPYLPLWQLVSYGFIHDTSMLEHLLFNMLGLYFFGTMVERQVGSKRMGIAYFGAMLAGALGHLIAGWLGNGAIPAVGASGAVLGIMLVAAVLQPNAKVIFILFPMTLKTLVMIIVGLDAFALLRAFRDGSSDGVAHWVHIGGAAFGFFWARKGLIHVDWTAKFAAQRQEALRERESDAAMHMDALLIKIQKEGISSLTDKERAFLKKMSERGKR